MVDGKPNLSHLQTMLQMMGAFAEFDRSLINERQREGIAAEREAGKLFGRKEALSEEQVGEINKRAAESAGK